MRDLPTLKEIVRALSHQHGAVRVPLPRTAFEWVLWENVAYLADEAKRAEAFTLLKATVGTSPADVLAARNPALLAVTRHGIVADLFARKLRAAATIANDKFSGDVDKALAPDEQTASRQLRAFPGIGEPGAEKILVAIGRARTLPLDSNGLRVLLRIGFGTSLRSYSATYRSVKDALAVGGASGRELLKAHVLLQRHGREICRRSVPECERCALRSVCAVGLTTLAPSERAGE